VAAPIRGYFFRPSLDEFRAAYDAMRAGDMARASAAFQALHAQHGDPVSAYHARLRQAV
jgi:hypothetical protein